MHTSVAEVKPTGIVVSAVPRREGCGSTNVMFDLLLDGKSNVEAAFSPKKLEAVLRAAVKKSKMTLRMSLLDVWESENSGPASVHHSLSEQFISLGESHLRIETWPEDNHVQGEAQLCNYSRDNSMVTRMLVEHIIKALNPASVQILTIKRGPGPDLVPLELTRYKRGGCIKSRKY